MAKVNATEIRAGNLLEWDKRVWRVLKSYHVHVGGRGGAYMQVEMKDIEAGTKVNQRFRTDEKIERAFVEARDMEYLYHDGDNYIFMDKESFEQLQLSAEFLEGQKEYLLPNTDVQVNFHNERPIGVQLPGNRGAHHHRDRAHPEGRHRNRQLQAGQDRNRAHRDGSALRWRGREDQGQHRLGRVRRTRLTR